MTNLDSILKSRDITLPTKVHLVKAMVFPVVMYGCELDCEESWALKNWWFWTVVLESPLDCKEIQPVHPKGGQSWVFIGGTAAKAETPILWPPDAKSWLVWKDPNAGKDWGQEKGTTEDEMTGWHHQIDGHGFGWTLGVGYGQRGLACCGSWGRKESDTTERLNWNELNKMETTKCARHNNGLQKLPISIQPESGKMTPYKAKGALQTWWSISKRGIILDCLGGPSIITKILTRGGRSSEVDM